MPEKSHRRYALTLALSSIALAAMWIGLVKMEIAIDTQMPAAKWYDELVDVKLNIANRTESPKLLIVGGSGTHFGVRAERIQSELGIPAVNFGLFADISLPVLLNLVSSTARPGDKVVLALEYELYAYDIWHPQAGLVEYALNGNTDVLSQLPLLDRTILTFSIPPERLGRGYYDKFRGAGRYENNAEYNAATVNRFGDETSFAVTQRVRAQMARAVESGKSGALIYGIPEPNRGWKILEQFIQKSRKSGVEVFATFPNLMDKPIYQKPLKGEEEITAFYRAHDVPVLGTARDARFNRDLFYDTIYHLNEKGREIRTERLINFLRPYITSARVSP